MAFTKLDHWILLAEIFPLVVSELSYIALSVHWQINFVCASTGGPIHLV